MRNLIDTTVFNSLYLFIFLSYIITLIGNETILIFVYITVIVKPFFIIFVYIVIIGKHFVSICISHINGILFFQDNVL